MKNGKMILTLNWEKTGPLVMRNMKTFISVEQIKGKTKTLENVVLSTLL